MKTQKQQGFTIIEVVLVLAIAGLIFLIVFLAVPALQRSQRDTARKNDLSRLMSQVSSFQSNSKGAVPGADSTNFPAFVSSYLNAGGDSFTDPGGTDYGSTPLTFTYAAGTPSSAGNIIYAVKARCGSGGAVATATTNGARQVAASIGLEGGGAFCQQN